MIITWRLKKADTTSQSFQGKIDLVNFVAINLTEDEIHFIFECILYEARLLKLLVVACNLRQTLDMEITKELKIHFNLAACHSLFAPRGIVLVVLYSCIVIL